MDFLGQTRLYVLFFFSQEITLQQIMSQIANVKKDMIILEKSEFSALRSENEVKLKSHSYLSSAFLLGFGDIMCIHKSVHSEFSVWTVSQMKKRSLTGTPRPAVIPFWSLLPQQKSPSQLTWPLTGCDFINGVTNVSCSNRLLSFIVHSIIGTRRVILLCCILELFPVWGYYE